MPNFIERHRRHHHHPCFSDHRGKWFLTIESEGDFTVSIIGGKIMLQLSDSLLSTLGVSLQDAAGNAANMTGVTVAFSIDNTAVGVLTPNVANPNTQADFTPGTDATDVANITAAVSVNGTVAFSITAQVQLVSGVPVSGSVILVSTSPLPAPAASAAAINKS